jgi:replication factor C small subunit
MSAVSTHENIVNKLNNFYIEKRIPHIIFYGPSSCGKKRIVFNFLNMIYGNESNVYSNVMFVNCAHGKGIKFIREELKFFAKTNTQYNTGVSFKSIVLLNAEHLTVDAQSAMRRCIEQYSNNTRFFIIINNKSKLLVPILSRFCEIYIPPHLDDNGNPIYLAQRELENQYPIHELNSTKMREIDRIMNEHSSLSYKEMAAIAKVMHEKALSSNDLIDWMKSQTKWSELEKANIGMYFMKVKSEFRSEKLLLLYMLDIMVFHPMKSLRDNLSSLQFHETNFNNSV